jgi:hypothetical protein
MSRHRINRIDQQFNARTIEMMASPAYRTLSVSAHRVLDRVCIELANHGGNNNGKLPVTYEHFMEYGVHHHAIGPAIRELTALGFLEVTQAGRSGTGETRWPNHFRIPWVVCKSNPQPVHHWRRFKTLKDAEIIAAAARKASAKPRRRHRTPLRVVQ